MDVYFLLLPREMLQRFDWPAPEIHFCLTLLLSALLYNPASCRQVWHWWGLRAGVELFQSALPTWGTAEPWGQTLRHTDRCSNIPEWIPTGQARPESRVCFDFSSCSSLAYVFSPSTPIPSYFKHREVSRPLIPRANENGMRPALTIKCWMTLSPQVAELHHLTSFIPL